MFRHPVGLLLVLCLAAAAHAQRIAHAPALPPITVSELEPLSAMPMRAARTHHQKPTPLDVWLAAPVTHGDVVANAAAPIAAPPMTASFPSIGESESQWAPADASGAVGRTHLVAVTNGGVAVHRRNGERVIAVRLHAFFGDANDVYFDPRVVYDASADRWIVTALRDERELLLAVSRSGDPTATWSRYRLGAAQLRTTSIDFMQLVLTRDTVLVATYDCAYACSDSLVVSVAKKDLYSAASPLPLTVYGVGYDITLVANEDSAVEYVIEGGRSLTRLDRLPESVRLQQPPCSCSYTAGAPQKGTSEWLDTGSRAVHSAVLRNGAIYAARAVSVMNPPRESIQWVKFHPDSGVLLDYGWVDDPKNATFYAYPSLAVNRSGAMVIGFAAMSKDTYPSAGYAFRDAARRVSTAATIRAGETAYTNARDFNGQRWGDYTATVVDPLSDNTFWTFQIVAMQRQWVTWWAKIETSAKRHSARH